MSRSGSTSTTPPNPKVAQIKGLCQQCYQQGGDQAFEIFNQHYQYRLEQGLDGESFLSDAVKALENLQKDQKALEDIDSHLSKIRATENKSTAGAMSAEDLQLINGRMNPDSKTPTLGKFQLLHAESICRQNIKTRREAIDKLTTEGGIGQEAFLKPADYGLSKSRTSYDLAQALGSGLKSAFHHTVGQGLITSSKPTDDSRWDKFIQYRDEFLDHTRNAAKVINPSDRRLTEVTQQFKNVLMSQEEFSALSKHLIKQSETEDVAHQDYLEKLRKVMEEANKGMLDKLDDNGKTKDNLHLVAVAQLLLLAAPFIPVPFAGMLLNVFQPFLSGALNLPGFLSSLFSTSGPFGPFAYVADKMQLPTAVNYIFGNLLGGPSALVGGVLQSATPVTGAIGQFLSAGDVGAALLAGGVASYLLPKKFDQWEKSAKILPDAKKSMRETYQKLTKEEDTRVRAQSGESAVKELEFREQKFPIWQAQEFAKNLYYHDSEKFKKILGAVTKKSEAYKQDADDILNKLQNDKIDEVAETNKALKLMLVLRDIGDYQGEKVLDAKIASLLAGTVTADELLKQYNAAEKNSQREFYLREAESMSINLAPSPNLQEHFRSQLEEHLMKNIVNQVDQNYFLYGQELGTLLQQSPPQNLDDVRDILEQVNLSNAINNMHLVDRMKIVAPLWYDHMCDTAKDRGSDFNLSEYAQEQGLGSEWQQKFLQLARNEQIAKARNKYLIDRPQEFGNDKLSKLITSIKDQARSKAEVIQLHPHTPKLDQTPISTTPKQPPTTTSIRSAERLALPGRSIQI